MKKSIFKTKTFWVNLLMALVVIIPELVDLGFDIPVKWSGLAIIVVNLILRLMTTQPAGLKGAKKRSKPNSN